MIWLKLETDSLAIKKLLTDPESAGPMQSVMVENCIEFIKKDWSLEIEHIYREANLVADGVANLTTDMSTGLHMLEIPPEDVWRFLEEDSQGVAFTRWIRQDNVIS